MSGGLEAMKAQVSLKPSLMSRDSIGVTIMPEARELACENLKNVADLLTPRSYDFSHNHF